MGRHSSGTRNFRLSGGLITIICVIILLAALIYGWTLLRAHNEADDAAYRAECFEGTLDLPVYETTPGLSGVSLDSWRSTNPVVRDYCIEPHLVADPADAALIIALSDKDLDASLTQSQRSVAGAPTPTTLSLSVAAREGSDSAAPAENTSFPEGRGAAPALALSSGDVEKAETLLRRDRMVTPEKSVEQQSPGIATSVLPEGYHWVPAGASTGVLLAPLTVSDRIEEDQARSAAALTEYLNDADRAQGQPELDRAALDDLIERQLRLPAVDTLFLLDTSERMRDPLGERSAFDAARAAVLDASHQLDEQHHPVGLMTYSAAHGPERPESVRRDAGFGPARDIEESLKDRGPEQGAPQSRPAVRAAIEEAQKHRRETGADTRLIVLTTGHDDMNEDNDYREFLASARHDGLDLQFIQVGYSPMDPVVSDHHPTMAYDEAQLREAVGRLSGTWL